MSEHAHEWIPNIYDSGHQVCTICGADKMEWLEQQLAQAQAEQATMRVLLERATFEMENWNEDLDSEIRAYLAAHPTQD